MITKIRFSKAFPDAEMEYGAAKTITEFVYSENFMTNDHAEELRRIGKLFGKYCSQNERKSFSIVLSPSPNDNPTNEELIEVGRYLMRKYFDRLPYEMSIHLDKGKDAEKDMPVKHLHIYGGVIDPITGKKMHLSDSQRRRIQDDVDRYVSQKFRWMTIDRRSTSRISTKGARKPSSGQYSWVEDLRLRVVAAYEKSNSFDDFRLKLKDAGVGVLLNRKDGTTRNEIGFIFQSKTGEIVQCQGPRLDTRLSVLAIAAKWPRTPLKADQDIKKGRVPYGTQTAGYAPGKMGKGNGFSGGGYGRNLTTEFAPCYPCPNTRMALSGTCESCRKEFGRKAKCQSGRGSSPLER